MRFLYAILCVLLISWAAFGQSPTKYSVENKVSKFSVVDKTKGVHVTPQKTVGWGQCSCGFGQCSCQGGNGCGCGMGFSSTAPNTVCQNGVCRVVSSPTQQFSGCASGSCSGGQPVSSGGWYPGKLLGRRR